MLPRALELILAPLYYVESKHLVLDFFLEFLKVYYKLVAVLVKSRPVLPLHQAMNLQLFVNHGLNFLHSLKDEEP